MRHKDGERGGDDAGHEDDSHCDARGREVVVLAHADVVAGGVGLADVARGAGGRGGYGCAAGAGIGAARR